MATTSRTKKTKSAQQWAWEFLRRNPDYRDAFQIVVALSPAQRTQVGMYRLDECDQQFDEAVLRSLDVQLFDTSDMMGFHDGQKTIGEYLDQTQRLHRSLKEEKIHLPIASKFKLETYSLVAWYDPDDELTANEAADMWNHEVPFDAGLIPIPEWLAEGVSFRNPDEPDEDIGWPARTEDEQKKPKIDKRRRKSPNYSSTALPLIKGVDENVFLIRPEGSLGMQPNQMQVSALFDLRLPISFQLSQIKELLEEHQEALVLSGFVQSLPKQADRFGAFSEYLEIIDMLDAGHTHLDIAKKLDGLTTTNEWKHDPKANKLVKVPKVVSHSKRGAPINELTQAVRKKIERAIGLRDHGYRALAFTAQ
jgi:hypothetical protein